MRKLEVLTAVAAPLEMNNVDTDQIFPARFTSKDRKERGFGDYYLHDLRYDENGSAKPSPTSRIRSWKSGFYDFFEFVSS